MIFVSSNSQLFSQVCGGVGTVINLPHAGTFVAIDTILGGGAAQGRQWQLERDKGLDVRSCVASGGQSPIVLLSVVNHDMSTHVRPL